MTSEISIPREDVAEFAGFGIRAFTTTREAGTFSLSGPDPVGEVMSRWTGLQDQLSPFARRTVIGRQVHGSNVITHRGGWEGLLRTGEADGHLAAERGIVLTVSIADCVPIFIAHPSGIVGLLHSGWRGTVARIVDAGINAFGRLGLPPDELKVHLGPSICGRCYEVSADVRAQLTGQPVNRAGNVDLRSLIAEHARELGVTDISVSPDCTKCDNDRYFSHRAGDAGRQLGVIVG
ncbi:MAG TPA: polyphenol oxidase family protein, partial [Gemmatimonadaceae bacterium]|nr:polyphenol oxidase family protein [Gemmatimonadaceae bacterium]